MYINRLWMMGVALLLMLTVSGCGDGNSNTNGTMTLTVVSTDLGGGLSNLTATALFSKPVPGIKFSFSGRQFSLTNSNIFTPPPGEAWTDSTGTAEMQFNVVQNSEPTYFEVYAATGGLYKTVTVPIPKYP